MTSHTKRAEAIFAQGKTLPVPAKWEQIQDEERAQRQALQAKQKSARLARETAIASAAALAAKKLAGVTARAKPARRRKAIPSAP